VSIDPCATNNGGCAVVATCTNHPGVGPTCACVIGYRGTGRGEGSCTPFDECTVNNGGCDTSPPATCKSVAGIATMCGCPVGSMGDGVGTKGCTDIDECAIDNGGCTTSPMAVCSNLVSARACFCPNGYRGSAVGSGGCVNTPLTWDATTVNDPVTGLTWQRDAASGPSGTTGTRRVAIAYP
jgi:cubilin